MSKTPSFFDKPTQSSLVKMEIVSKYLTAWAKVIIPTAKIFGSNIAYIDLFSGPGRYNDGTKSTPLLVLETAIQDEKLRQMLITVFNDVDRNHADTLKTEIEAIVGVGTLKHKPEVNNEEVGEDIVRIFEQARMIPTLFFIDPWGYKGLSLRLLKSVLKDWGCDCIFFFNYNRINSGIDNKIVHDHMAELFGKERAITLRQRLNKLLPSDRESTIIEELIQSIKEAGGNYVLPFCFKDENEKRTSHYLIFVSKNHIGYHIMKGVLAGQSSNSHQGVPSFEYEPKLPPSQSSMSFHYPLDDLEIMLMDNFAGQSLTMKEIYEKHNVGRPFIEKNYKDALRNLEAAEKIITYPPVSKRRKKDGKVTFGEGVIVTFP